MSANGAGSSLAAAFVAAQMEMPHVEPDAQNPHYKTRFVSLDHLIAKTRPVLNKHGLGISQPVFINDHGLSFIRTTLIHNATKEERDCGEMPLILGKNDMQGLGAAITYARRYAWAAALGISSELDDDGETAAAGGREAAAPAAADAAASSRPPAAKPRGKNMITRPQHAKIAILVKELDEAASPIPGEFAGAESWVDVLRQRLDAEYGVKSRTELSSRQAGELIEWLDAQAIPF